MKLKKAQWEAGVIKRELERWEGIFSRNSG